MCGYINMYKNGSTLSALLSFSLPANTQSRPVHLGHFCHIHPTFNKFDGRQHFPFQIKCEKNYWPEEKISVFSPFNLVYHTTCSSWSNEGDRKIFTNDSADSWIYSTCESTYPTWTHKSTMVGHWTRATWLVLSLYTHFSQASLMTPQCLLSLSLITSNAHHLDGWSMKWKATSPSHEAHAIHERIWDWFCDQITPKLLPQTHQI